MIVTTDHRIPSARQGYEVLLRNKHFGGNHSGEAGKTVLFVHGATYGATDTFDYAIDGQSWMDLMAEQGFDAWCLDLLGYGQSDRPSEMDEAPTNHPPLVDTAHAVLEVDNAVTYILHRRDIQSVDLIGYSWGTAICGSYAGQHLDKVDRLVLSGALWIEGLVPTGKQATSLGAYRTVDVEAMMSRWATGLDGQEIDDIVSEQARRRWCQHTASCDPTFNKTGLLRAPTGVMKDYSQCREAGADWYDPSLIRSPVLIIVGHLDVETTPAQGQRLFERLTHAQTKQMTVIGQGTHSLLLEKHRHQLYAGVSNFLQD